MKDTDKDQDDDEDDDADEDQDDDEDQKKTDYIWQLPPLSPPITRKFDIPTKDISITYLVCKSVIM